MMEEKNWLPIIKFSRTFTHAQWKVHAVPTINNGKIILISKMNYTDLRLIDWVNQEWRNDRYKNQIAGVG